MKKWIAVVSFVCVPVLAHAANDDKEAQCQKVVNAKLEAMEAASEKAGKEVKLKDLSMLDIMNLAKVKGACAAQEEISRREK
ncbi:MAG TPA: hypothetical protein VIY48_02970 [Candidatus Paceibacterota bacterium]